MEGLVVSDLGNTPGVGGEARAGLAQADHKAPLLPVPQPGVSLGLCGFEFIACLPARSAAQPWSSPPGTRQVRDNDSVIPTAGAVPTLRQDDFCLSFI